MLLHANLQTFVPMHKEVGWGLLTLVWGRQKDEFGCGCEH